MYVCCALTAVCQLESTWVLDIVTTKHAQAVTAAGAVPVFTQLLKSPHDDVKEHALRALGNITGDSAKCRDLVLNAHAMPALLQLCTQEAKTTLLRNATWTMCNLCRSVVCTVAGSVADKSAGCASLRQC